MRDNLAVKGNNSISTSTIGKKLCNIVSLKNKDAITKTTIPIATVSA